MPHTAHLSRPPGQKVGPPGAIGLLLAAKSKWPQLTALNLARLKLMGHPDLQAGDVGMVGGPVEQHQPVAKIG